MRKARSLLKLGGSRGMAEVRIMALGRVLATGVWLLLAGALATAQDLNRRCSGLGMPFSLVSNFEIVVQVKLNEGSELRFVLDTGSSHSTMDRRVAERMGLHRRPGTVFSFDRNLAVEWTDVSELRMGPMHLANIRMMVARLADLSELAQDIDGIIGMDVLSRARTICIDYERSRFFFTLGNESGLQPSAMKGFVIPVTIQGIPMHLLVDTGFEYVLLYKDRLRSALPHLQTDGEPRSAVLGRLRAEQVNLPGVQIAGPEATASVLMIERRGNAGLDGVDGYFGPAALHARRVELDFAGKTLRWE